MFPCSMQIWLIPTNFSTHDITQGGIDQYNKLMTNFVAYNLVKKYWFELTIAKVEPKLL